MLKRSLLGLSILVFAVTFRGTAYAHNVDCALGCSEAVAFVRIDGSTAAITAFGGKSVKTVSAVRNGAGHYTITFTCAAANCYFHKGFNTDSIVAIASAETGRFCIASAIVDSVGRGQIVVELSTWRVDSLIETDNNVAVVLFEA